MRALFMRAAGWSTVYDLIVVGGGFWGTAAAVIAREAGLDVLLLDDRDPRGASRNAAGITTLSWYAYQKATRVYSPFFVNLFGKHFDLNDAKCGVRWMLDRDVMHQTGEEFFYGHSHKTRPQTYLLNSPDAFFALAERTFDKAQKLVKGTGYWVVLTETREHLGKCVLLATGAFTDILLEASDIPPLGVSGLRGRGLLVDPHKTFDVPITVRLTLSKYYALRPWIGHMARVGDTVEKGDQGDKPLDDLKVFAERLVPGYTVKKVFDGLRPTTLQGALIEEIKPGLVVATGGHRVGLALAPSAARKALALLGVQ